MVIGDLIADESVVIDPEFQVVPVAANDKSVGWHGNAVLVRRGVQADLVERIDLPGLEPRGAVHVRVDLGHTVEIIATHLGLLRRHRRRHRFLSHYDQWAHRAHRRHHR